ncbi:MAG TPA: DUF4340 domain-containing protein [Steroidobacteraceae bacterium]|jgi:hypothetical protein|nr:DUF4340 domain-containing protein [Steroidobacteraceae bacterium]
MSRQRLIALLIAALVAISGALYLSTQRNLPRDVHGTSLWPALAGELDTVTSLSVLKGGATPSVTVQKQGQEWTVAERANYPADVAKLRTLLLALSETKIREEKTSNPASYSIIGVEDPTKPGAASAQIDLTAKDGKHGVIVGKSVAGGNFVRRAGENTSYVVEPGITFEAEPRYWIDTRLLDIASDKIQSIEFKPATGPAYSVRRVVDPASKAPEAKADSAAHAADDKTAGTPAATPPPPPASHFVLEGAPSGRLAADQETLAPAPNFLSNLADEDVSKAGDIDFGKPMIVTVTLADGSVITLTGVAIGDKRWIQVAASKDAALSAKANSRAFEIATYRYDGIFKPLEQLLVPKPAPTPKSGADAKASPAAPSTPSRAKKPAAAPRP